MGTGFLVMFAFLFLQRFGTSSNTMMMSSSNVTCIESERQSLFIFKQSLADRLNRLSTWTGVECCAWQGVRCDWRNGHVVKLDLRNPVSFTAETCYNGNWLGGELSPSLLNLKHLRYLDLSMNNFSGLIPEFLGSFKHLKHLNLSRSGFYGVIPHHLGNLSRLQYLDLTNNFLVESDVHVLYGDSFLNVDDLRWVSSLSSLKHLDLSGIMIGEDIDWLHAVDMLPSLLTLNLAFCEIKIPYIKIVNFTSLKIVPWTDGTMNPDLEVVNLSKNNFKGSIPIHLCKVLGIKVLDLTQNKFSGRLPRCLGNLNRLQVIDLTSNTITGAVPSSLGSLRYLQSLHLRNNRFEGNLPVSLQNLTELVTIDLGNNLFMGSIPLWIGQNLSNLRILNLQSNKFTGEIPLQLCHLQGSSSSKLGTE